MNEAKKVGVTNLRVICEDAVEVLSGGLGPQSLDGVQIYFPDPWHKKRHHKRRIVQPDFISLLARRVRLGGFVIWRLTGRLMPSRWLKCLVKTLLGITRLRPGIL